MVFDFPGFRLDSERRHLAAIPSGDAVALTAKAFDCLLVLVQHAGQVVGKDALLKAVWPTVIVEKNNLERHISMLRRALGERAGKNRYIVTLPGKGYQFVAPVTVAGAKAEAPANAAPPSPPAQSQIRRPALYVLAGVLVALGVLLIAWIGHRSSSSPVVAANTSANLSIAVLPFTNLTGEPDKEYLGEGLAEELIHRLTQGSRIRVPARTSSFAYRGKDVDLRKVGRDLGVTYVLEGSVRAEDNRVRATVQMVDATTGFHAWSQSYERDFEDVFALQDELAAAVLQRLSPGLQAGGTTGVEERPPTQSVEAWKLFLQANAISSPGDANLSRALSLYNQALERDPDFVRARVSRANTHLARVMLGFAPASDYAVAEGDVRRALELDPSLAAAHGALASVLAAQGRWAEALQSFDKARSLDPADPLLLNAMAVVRASVGDLDGAVEASEQAVRLAPLSPATLMVRAQLHALHGDYAKATALLDQCVALGVPSSFDVVSVVFGEKAMLEGRPQEAARRFVATLSPEARAAGAETVMTQVYAARRDAVQRPAAAKALHQFMRRVPFESVDHRHGTTMVTLYAMVGDMDAAYAAVNGAVNYYATSRAIGHPWFILWNPMLSEFREDPRFAALVTRLKMTDYWAQAGPPNACRWTDSGEPCTELHLSSKSPAR